MRGDAVSNARLTVREHLAWAQTEGHTPLFWIRAVGDDCMPHLATWPVAEMILTRAYEALIEGAETPQKK